MCTYEYDAQNSFLETSNTDTTSKRNESKYLSRKNHTYVVGHSSTSSNVVMELYVLNGLGNILKMVG